MSDVLERLDGCARRIKQLMEELRAERGRRNDLIVDARDEDHAYRPIARAADLALSRVANIVAEAA